MKNYIVAQYHFGMWQHLLKERTEKRYLVHNSGEDQTPRKMFHVQRICGECRLAFARARRYVVNGVSSRVINKSSSYLCWNELPEYELIDIWENIASFLYVRMESVMLCEGEQRHAVTVYGEPAWHVDHLIQIWRFASIPSMGHLIHTARLLYTNEEEFAIVSVLI
jgi:hypothetical protein